MLARLKAWIAEPLVVFALLGTGVFLLFDRLAVDTETVTIPGPTVVAFEQGFRLQRGREPEAHELDRAMAGFRREEVLFREALRRGLHWQDGVVRNVLVDRMGFVLAGVLEPADEIDLVNFYADHIDRYRGDRRVSFSHRFFATAPPQPSAVLDSLRAGEAVASDAHFWLAELVRDYPLQMLGNTLGADNALALIELEPGSWEGPFRSTLGHHYLKLDELRPRRPMPFHEVRDQVQRDWAWEQRMAAIDQEIATLPTRYVFREP
ncbi:MAG: peptidyl-prolyl cis-trans isomerase [Gammaproteobacteria bacterium]|nr:peptidyl-prolyl cis-trans isomerase [Gammaproteobacteria bacterium]